MSAAKKAAKGGARKELGRYGKRGQYVRVVVERGLVRVLWTEGHRRFESWPDTKENRKKADVFAEGTYLRLSKGERPPEALTLLELWEQYELAEVHALAPKTQSNYAIRWGTFQTFAGRAARADLITPRRLDEFRDRLVKLGRAPEQIRSIIGQVKRVYRWAMERRLIAPSLIPTYKVKLPRSLKGPTMAEYSREEALKILAQWDPRDSRQWRPWVLTVLFAFMGPRQNATRHLTWEHVDFAGGRLLWVADTDKMGTERWQPMPAPVVEALWVAYGWRTWAGFDGAHVFFGVQARTRGVKPYTYSAYNQQLHDAERRAGVPTIPYRAAHGFRRGVVGDVYDATGDLEVAAAWIGDRSTKVVKRHYLKDRDARLQRAADAIGATTAPSGMRTRPAPAPENDDAAPAATETASADEAITYDD